MKTCTKCGETKPLDCFHKSSQSKDGHKARCKKCNVAEAVAHNRANPERRRKVLAAYRQRNVDRVKTAALKYAHSERGAAKRAEWAAANQASARQRARIWVKSNPERTREHKSKWSANNRAYIAAKTRQRQAAKLNATPLWANTALIALYYATRQYLTQDTGFDWHVDHIVPLQGRNVCGLHVHFNLRVIPAKDNLSKSNHFPIE